MSKREIETLYKMVKKAKVEKQRKVMAIAAIELEYDIKPEDILFIIDPGTSSIQAENRLIQLRKNLG